MKRQYLGDSKDSFKWDYHHFLVEALGYRHFKIAWMMTPDDAGTNGRTPSELFPAREEILRLCNELRLTRDPALLSGLPARTKAQYVVSFHTPDEIHLDGGSSAFFSGIEACPGQVLFLDPDNGFEPEHSSTDKHVRYADLDGLIKTVSPNTVVTVFQHHRRKKFPDDFARIRERLLSGHCCAIYWHSLMFVALSPSAVTIAKVHEINRAYAQCHPVQIIA